MWRIMPAPSWAVACIFGLVWTYPSRDTVTWDILRYKIKKYKSRGFISAGDSLKALSRILSSKVDYITQNNLQYIQPNRYKTTIISHILWLISYES